MISKPRVVGDEFSFVEACWTDSGGLKDHLDGPLGNGARSRVSLRQPRQETARLAELYMKTLAVLPPLPGFPVPAYMSASFVLW